MKAVILGILLGLALPAQSKCQLLQIAQWSLRPAQYRPVVDGTINGKPVGVLLDTGVTTSMIRRSAAEALGLKRSPLRGPRLFGVGGETSVEGAYVEELRIGGAAHRNWIALVAGEQEFQDDLALILGLDFLETLDIEFDLPHNAVRLFQPKDCGGAALGYWSKDGLAVPFAAGSRVTLAVKINGESLIALLDSGASLSTLSLEAAMALGISAKTAGVVAGGCMRGIGKERLETWIAPLESFIIGEETIRSPRLRFADLWLHMRYDHTGSSLRRRIAGLPDLLLGADFLRSHRVLVAHSQRKMYFSYVGGTVFPGTPGKPCAERNN
jgi:predicted aspartyl protease